MPELDDAALERRLRAALKEHLGPLPFDLTVETLDRRREAKGVARRPAGGRGMTLLAAAALLLVGGALAAGAGLLRQTPLVVVATASPDAKVPRESTAPPSATPIPVAGPGGAWIPVGSMSTPRARHYAVRLLDGRVLALRDGGGPFFDSAEQGTAEVYDPATGTWSGTGKMLKPLNPYGAPVLLLDGRVLASDIEGGGRELGTEVYDAASGTWTATGTMPLHCEGEISLCSTLLVRLSDGRVLLTLPDAQLYDPASGSWTATGKMNVPHFLASAALLSDGKVLVSGGVNLDDWNPTGPDEEHPLFKSAEVYDPATGSWEEIANMASPDAGGTAKLLRDGEVRFVDGGLFQLYNPATGAWPPVVPPGFNTRRVLSDGTVILMNVDETENYPVGQCTATALYDTHTETLTPVTLPPCAVGSSFSLWTSSFTLLLDGTILVAGGEECTGDGVCVPSRAAGLYVPAGMPLPAFPASPNPDPLVSPSPTVSVTPVATPEPTRLPAAAGPVPPNARSWTVTVENRSSEPAALFVANDMLQLVGSATPNVVPAGATMKVTFRFPVDGGLIYVNPRPGDGWLVSDQDIGIPGKIVVGGLGGDGAGWVSP